MTIAITAVGFERNLTSSSFFQLRFRAPERLTRRNELDRDSGDESFQPARTFFHAGLLRGDVTEDDQGFLFALAYCVRHIFDRLPLPRLADDQGLHFRHLERPGMMSKSSSAGSEGEFGYT